MVKILLDKKPDMVNAKNRHEDTPLFVAASRRDGKFFMKKKTQND